PTFLLWRRMKLWELRSYEAVIKLEQDRLVYQARLRSRFGRAWRRKAPVESLMPLRLARYGVPLAQTAPAGLAAAGIEPRLLPAAPQQTTPAPEPPIEAAEVLTAESSRPRYTKQLPAHQVETADSIDYFGAYEDFLAEYQVVPTAAQFAHYLRVEHETAQDDSSPLPEVDLVPLLAGYAARSEASVGRQDLGNAEGPQAEVPVSEETWAAFYRDVARAYGEEFGASPDSAAFAQHLRERYNLDAPEPHLLPAEMTAEQLPAPHAADMSPAAGLTLDKTLSDEVPVPSQRARAQIDVALDTSATVDDGGEAREGLARLTNPDLYYLAYQQYVDTHGMDPKGRAAWEEVSQQLAASGVLGDKGQPVSPSTLRRYALEQRIYRRWADEYERFGEPPGYEALLDRLAHDGIKSGNRQLTLDDLQRGEHLASGFERRYDALHCHN
ncbi:hypothetical protein ACFVFJ_46325, partial [Streptomyces sp. NPDC057717]